jgi:hypothetical protein
MTIALIVIGVLGVGMVLVAYGTVAENRWGVNFDPVSCPRCNTPLPRHRHPRTTRQALWGGGTCAKCEIEIDKWGREVSLGSKATTSPGKRSQACHQDVSG